MGVVEGHPHMAKSPISAGWEWLRQLIFSFSPLFFSSFFNVFPFFFFTSAFWGLTRGYRSNFKNFVPKNDHFL
jgi:hypothetical protein